MDKNRKLINALLVSSMMLANVIPVAFAASQDQSVVRLGGSSRVETSFKVSEEAYATGSKTVVLAGWNGEVDALTGTLLASAKDAPLLIVEKGSLAKVKTQIKKIGADEVILLGGTKAISQEIQDDLTENFATVRRVSGAGRYETAAAVAKEVNGGKADHVFITSDGLGGALADALTAGPASGSREMPILITGKDTLNSSTLKAIKDLDAKKATIVGGSGVVSDTVKTELEKAGLTVDRKSGKDRFLTATAVAKEYFPESKKAIVANFGANEVYADALVGGYLGAKIKAPVLLTPARSLQKDTANYLSDKATFAYILGGTAAVSESTLGEIKTVIDSNKIEEAKEAKLAEIAAVELESEGMTANSIEAAEARLVELKEIALENIKALETVEDVEAYEFDVTEAEDLLVKELAIESVSAIADIEVAFDGIYELPLEVEVILIDNSTVRVPVTWDESAVEVNKAGTYQIVGILDISALGNVAETDLTASINVVVAPRVDVESILLSHTELTLIEGENSSLSATVLPKNATNKKLLWSSSDENIVTVNEHGVVQANSAGEATIIVTDTLGNVTKDVIVTVKKPTIDSIEDITTHIIQNDTYTLPTTVTALMSNGTEEKHTINWIDDYVDTSILGNQYFEGTVEGYGESITLTLVVKEYEPKILTNSYSAITINNLSKSLNLSIINNGTKPVNIEKVEIYERGKLYTTYTTQRLIDSGISTVVQPKQNWGISINSKFGIWLDNSYVKYYLSANNTDYEYEDSLDRN